ncbi:hypothetical protein ACCAA_180020 [Candidatus Accumulibacter aalborgensis]|uniref:Condensation domain-containing protein n=1 Tax=Candidatus Accumulibacter aalborgensis TaxID=1860102 RepID=A0A1A8XK02_9PROT|nr:hypothetical protein ACCAA_180020 [Candidatus Accumulibacter aalborgensis]
MSRPSVLRPLDPAAAFFFLADRVSCMNFVAIAERSGALDAQRIRSGLEAMQAGNPLLRTRVVWTADGGLCFAEAPGYSIGLECRTTNADDWQTEIERELARPFADDEAPLIRCLYLQMSSAERSVPALCCHHSIADQPGTRRHCSCRARSTCGRIFSPSRRRHRPASMSACSLRPLSSMRVPTCGIWRAKSSLRPGASWHVEKRPGRSP